MGYTTTFEGRFELDKPLKPEHLAYLKAFCTIRHVKWNVDKIASLPDPEREAVELPLGEDGEYFVGITQQMNELDFVADDNYPPGLMPSLWCGWRLSDEAKYIEWNGWEKFYGYIEWLYILIGDFLKPWGYVLNGEVSWQGEDMEDYGKIVIEQNKVYNNYHYFIDEYPCG